MTSISLLEEEEDPVTPAASPSTCDVTVVILTFNEEIHICRSIKSVVGFARSVLVVDSYSTDRTPEIARSAGARFLQHRFVNQAEQFQWALDHGNIETEWVLRLDADEIIEPDLGELIASRLPSLPKDVAGVNFNRKHVFLGRWVRHGGRYPLLLLRLWRTKQGRVERRWMDEHIVVWGGRTLTFEGGFSDVNLNDLGFFTAKHNSYATREAIDILGKKYGLFPQDDAFTSTSVSRQAYLKRLLKERLYNRLPLWAGPFAYLFFRLLIQRGIFDGQSGIIYHVLQGFWYRFLVNAKVYEFDLILNKCTGNLDRCERLGKLTGYDFSFSQNVERK